MTLANLVVLGNAALAFTETLQLAPLMLLSPFIMVMITGKGFKALKGVSLITLISGLSFVLPQLAVTYFVGQRARRRGRFHLLAAGDHRRGDAA